MTKKVFHTLPILFLPICFCILLIPLISNDYILAGVYLMFTVIFISYNGMKNDWLVYLLGFFSMIFFETIFILTGVETFIRNSLFGIMPIWLPFLWAFAFLIMRRALKLFENI